MPISSSQVGSGTFFGRLPDPSLRTSVVPSSQFVSTVQRHVGLYVSALRPVLDALSAASEPVTQHDRLGDETLNSANATARHNAGLRALFDAVSAASGSSVVRLGDKGDGTHASKEDARRRHTHLNATHIPDIIEGTNTLYEYKCFTTFKASQALGLGSQQCGGAPSTADRWPLHRVRQHRGGRAQEGPRPR